MRRARHPRVRRSRGWTDTLAPVNPTRSPVSRWLLPLLAIVAIFPLASCGGGNDNPFAGKAGTEDQPAGTAPLPTGELASPTSTGPEVGSPPVDPLPSNPAAAPGPADEAPSSTSAEAPSAEAGSLQEATAQDQQAMLNARTMVSIIEGCHSGRESYKDCNSQDELGAPDVLGITIGKGRGEVKISATPRGFRVTSNSESGAKFTVARGPGGDRFKCLPGPTPGACPADRVWSW